MSALERIVITPLLFSLHVATAFADDPPKLSVTATCNSVAQFSIAAGRDKKACVDDEHTAEITLGQQWSKFAASDKVMCVGTVRTGGPPSYVELLSCLEIMRDAKEVRAGNSLDRSNQPAPTGGRGRR